MLKVDWDEDGDLETIEASDASVRFHRGGGNILFLSITADNETHHIRIYQRGAPEPIEVSLVDAVPED